MTIAEEMVASSTRVIHVFDREGDITEVFEKINTLTHTGVVVRAAHNRSLKDDPHHLWEKLEAQPIVDDYEVDLIKTNKRQARQAKSSSEILSNSATLTCSVGGRAKTSGLRSLC